MVEGSWVWATSFSVVRSSLLRLEIVLVLQSRIHGALKTSVCRFVSDQVFFRSACMTWCVCVAVYWVPVFMENLEKSCNFIKRHKSWLFPLRKVETPHCVSGLQRCYNAPVFFKLESNWNVKLNFEFVLSHYCSTRWLEKVPVGLSLWYLEVMMQWRLETCVMNSDDLDFENLCLVWCSLVLQQ